MKFNSHLLCLSSLFFLSACLGGGGGGGSDGGGGQTQTNPPVDTETTTEPEVVLHLDASRVRANRGDALPISFSGTWTSARMAEDAVYIKIYDENDAYIEPAVSLAPKNDVFTVETTLHPGIQSGAHSPIIFAVACEDERCDRVYQESKLAVDIEIEIDAVPQWQTHQANASHNGYVPIYVSNASFAKLWEWRRKDSVGSVRGINAPVAGGGTVYLSTDVSFGDEAEVFALNELTGAETWRVSFGMMPALNAPAINDDTLFVSTSGHSDTKLWAVDRALGQIKSQSDVRSQWGHYLAPTVFENEVFQTGGYTGGSVYAYSIKDGSVAWESTGSSWGMDTPAVDGKHVYIHDGSALTILARANGEGLAKIPSPFGNPGYDYHGSPVLGSVGNVMAYSGWAFSGRASSNAEHFEERVISNFDIEKKELTWSSDYHYKTFFATSNGVVYAGRSGPAILEALDEATGEILWSWTPPSASDTSFHRNVVVTKNMLFVSTNANLYALDLSTREVVWSYSVPGMISLSDNRILFLAPGARESDGRLMAFDLRSR